MLTQKENKVKIEGVLSEINLKDGVYNKNGKDINTISGNIVVRVNQVLNGEETVLDIPVYMYAQQYTASGAINPAYESIARVMHEYVSIAASDFDHADRIRITNGNIAMNEYYSQSGKFVSFPRIRASFVSKVDKKDCKPEATFSIVMMVGQAKMLVDSDGVELNKYEITGMVPQYGGTIDVIPFYAINPEVISGVSTSWSEGDTVKALGKLNFTSTTEIHKVAVDFGEPVEETRTVSVSELVITGGSATPMDGDFAIDVQEVQEALAVRRTKMAELKDKAANRATTGKAPAKTASKAFDLGF